MNSKEELCPEPLMSPTETVSWTHGKNQQCSRRGEGGEREWLLGTAILKKGHQSLRHSLDHPLQVGSPPCIIS